MADRNELTPEEGDERNQGLIQDLRRMYPTRTQVEEPLARIQQRLFHGSAERLHDEVSTPPPRLPQHRRWARVGTVNTKARTWQRRLSTLAAAVFVALLVGTLILVLNQAHQSHTGGSGTPSRQVEAVASLHMIDATTGWAETQKAVLMTTDGGAHWKDVTPPGTALVPGSATDFLTASLAWIALPQAGKSTITIFYTSDGGRSWQQASVQAPFVKQITFIDAQHGWILSGNNNTAGAPAEPVSVFRTIDGGKTWQRVSTALFADATPPGHLPYGGQKSGIRFLSASTGWVTGTVVANNLAWLYVTHDGGATWYQQSLPRPSDVPPAQLWIQSPTFFSVSDGILPVRFADLTTGTSIATVIYVTHDGGATWKPTAPVPVALGVADFSDGQHGWVTDGTRLVATTDGGQHWVQRQAGTSFKDVTALDFVSSTLGWAISGQGVLKTTDGGQTWNPGTSVIA